MKRIISSLGVALACLSFAHTTSAQTLPFEYSTAANPKWYAIKSAQAAGGYASGQVFQVNGMEKNVTFTGFNNTSYQMFRFEQVAGQDSFKMINKKFPDGCLLSSGKIRYVARTYGAPKADYVAWALQKLNDQQYLILADDGILDKGEDDNGTPTLTPIRLHAQQTGKVIVSWPEEEANSASAWIFEHLVEDLNDETAQEAYAQLQADIQILIENTGQDNIGDGVGKYPQAKFDELQDLAFEMSSIVPETYEELVQNCDRMVDAMSDFHDSRGTHTPVLPQVSTAENPIWYLWRSDASDTRRDRILEKPTDGTNVKSFVDFDPSNPRQLWRLEKKGEWYALINKDGGSLSPKMENNGFVMADTNCFNFKIYHQDIRNVDISANTMVVVSDSGKAVHLENHTNFGAVSYNLEDVGSRFKFEDSAPLISDPIVFSTEGNDVWYYIKNKRQADKLANPRPYLTSHGDSDSIYVRVSTDGKESTYIYRTFGRSDTLAHAAGDSAKWKFVEKEIDQFSINENNEIVTIKVKKVLIINKLTGKCLNAFNNGDSKAVRFVSETETGDTVFPYWDVVDKTRDMWLFRSEQVTVVDGALQASTTYANFDNGPGLVLYGQAGDAGNIYWLEKATDFNLSTPITPVDNIKIYVTDGKIVVAGTDEKPSVYSASGARIDANKKLAQGVYVVTVGGKAAKVVVTK